MPDIAQTARPEKLSVLVALALEAGSCNTMEWAARLPIETDRAKSRYTLGRAVFIGPYPACGDADASAGSADPLALPGQRVREG